MSTTTASRSRKNVKINSNDAKLPDVTPSDSPEVTLTDVTPSDSPEVTLTDVTPSDSPEVTLTDEESQALRLLAGGPNVPTPTDESDAPEVPEAPAPAAEVTQPAPKNARKTPDV